MLFYSSFLKLGNRDPTRYESNHAPTSDSNFKTSLARRPSERGAARMENLRTGVMIVFILDARYTTPITVVLKSTRAAGTQLFKILTTLRDKQFTVCATCSWRHTI